MTLSTAHTSANAADAAKIVITGVADVFLQQLQICRTHQPAWSPGFVATTTSRRFLLGLPVASELSTRRRCLCGSVYMIQPIAIWPTCVYRPIPCMVASNSAFHRRLGLCWSRAPGQLPVSQRSYAINGPRIRNSLPADLRTPYTTLCSIKRYLKAHLFQQQPTLPLAGGLSTVRPPL